MTNMFLPTEPLKNRWFLRLLILKREVWCTRSGMAEASGQGGRRSDQILAACGAPAGHHIAGAPQYYFFWKIWCSMQGIVIRRSIF